MSRLHWLRDPRSAGTGRRLDASSRERVTHCGMALDTHGAKGRCTRMHWQRGGGLTRRGLLELAVHGGSIAAAALVGGGGNALAQESYDDLVRRGWAAVTEGNNTTAGGDHRRLFRQAIDLFMRADAIRPLGEGEYSVITRQSRHVNMDSQAALRYAQKAYATYPESPLAAYELCMSRAAAGQHTEARTGIETLAALPRAVLGDVAGDVARAQYDLATTCWETGFSLLHTEFQREFPRQAFARDGYYEWYYMPDTAYQRTSCTVAGGQASERDDGFGNRVMRLVPEKRDEPVELSFTFTHQPFRYDIRAVAQGRYDLPEPLRPLLAATTLSDPTSRLAQAVGAQVKGATRADTVLGACEWMACNFAAAFGESPEQTWFDRYYGPEGHEPTTDELLQHPVGHCWENSRLLACILRACGIAARQRLVINLWDDEPGTSEWGLGWHLIPEYYEPSVPAWIPLEGGLEVWPGVVPPRYIPVFGEQPELSDYRETPDGWRLPSVEKAWRRMWFGNKGRQTADCKRVERKLAHCSLTDPYPWAEG